MMTEPQLQARIRSEQETYTLMILLALVAVVVAGIVGVWLAKEMTVQILGFCTLIGVALLNLLQGSKAAAKVAEVAEKVEEVRHATNSLTDRLVETTEKEALLRGKSNERERSDAAKVEEVRGVKQDAKDERQEAREDAIAARESHEDVKEVKEDVKEIKGDVKEVKRMTEEG